MIDLRSDTVTQPTEAMLDAMQCVGWVEAVKADTHRDERMMGIAMLNPSYTY